MPDKITANSIDPGNPLETMRDETFAPMFVQEITDHVKEDGTILRTIVSRHSDGFVCLQIIPESDKPALPKTIRFGDPETEAPTQDLPAF